MKLPFGFNLSKTTNTIKEKTRSFFNGSRWGTVDVSDNFFITDNQITATELVEANKESVIVAIKTVLKNKITEKPYGFKAGKQTTKALMNVLKTINYDDIVEEWIEASFGSGGGNILMLFLKDNKVLPIPFIGDGQNLVSVKGGTQFRQIESYNLLQGGMKVAKYNAKDVLHFKFLKTDNYKFGTNPLVSASKYFVLKQRILHTLRENLKSRTTSTTIASPEASFFDGMNASERELFQGQWNSFKDALTDKHNLITSPISAKFTQLEPSLNDLKIDFFIKYLDQQMASSYVSSLSVIGISDGVNYANAESNRDNLSDLNVEPVKRMFERWTVRMLERLVPSFDQSKTPFYFGRELTEEELNTYNDKYENNKKTAEMLEKLQGVDGYEYDIDSNSIVKIEEKKKEKTIEEDKQETVEGIEEKISEERASKKSPIDIQIETKTAKSIKSKIEKAFLNQLLKEVKKRELDKIQSNGLNKDALLSYSASITLLALEIWNEQHDEELTENDLTDEFNAFLIGYIAITLYGYNEIDTIKNKGAKNTLEELFKNSKDYKGIDDTTNKKLDKINKELDSLDITQEEKEKLKKDKLEKLAKDRAEVLFNSIFALVFHKTLESIAIDKEYKYVGSITKRDDRVRPKHKKHDQKYWKLGSYSPWNDYNDRCSYYYYKDEKTAEENGFTKLNI